MMDMDVAPRKKKKKKILKVPWELGVVEGMNEEDLKKYMFPRARLQSSFFEQWLGMKLDAECKLDNPPPNVGVPFDPKFFHDRDVKRILFKATTKEFKRPKYNKMSACKIKPGEAVDLKSLLLPCQGDYLVRRKGHGKIKAKNLKGKYILVCCSYAPKVGGGYLWDLVSACSEMYSKLKGNFEMVVVTKMRHGWTQPRAKERDAFRQFFSAFPSPCLAVPIHARSRRHRIFNSLGVGFDPKVLLVGPDGHALLHCELNYKYPLQLVPINDIGSDPTPFPFRLTESLWTENCPHCSDFVNNPSSLKRLLSPSSDFLFRKVMSSDKGSASSDDPFVKEVVSLSDLNSKPVALYLYSTGEKLPLLRHIVQGCEKTNKDLEVVVVCLGVGQFALSFPEIFSRVLAPRRLTWWVAPHNFSASVVLRHMFQFEGDRVIMIGPNEQYVDVQGLQFMEIYGIYAHPFAFDSVVQKTVEELKQVTLDSFKKLLQIPECEECPSTAKRALFYFDCPYRICPSVYDQVVRFESYEEVLIHSISFDDYGEDGRHVKMLKPAECNPKDIPRKLLWRTKGAKEASDFFLRFFNHVFPTIVAFGEDGKICSLLAQNIPPSGHPELKGNLCEEVSSVLEKYVTDYNDLDYDTDGSYFHGVEHMQELRQSKFW